MNAKGSSSNALVVLMSVFEQPRIKRVQDLCTGYCPMLVYLYISTYIHMLNQAFQPKYRH
jgi:hypothetical protein